MVRVGAEGEKPLIERETQRRNDRVGIRLRGGGGCCTAKMCGIIAAVICCCFFIIGIVFLVLYLLPVEPGPAALGCLAKTPNFSGPVLAETAGECPTVDGLSSTTVEKEGFGKMCKWKNVRYATINENASTGQKTSGTGEDITYGIWGPAVMADSFGVVEPDVSVGEAAVEGTTRCLQWQSETGKDPWATGQADCLSLNIFAPPGANKLPVAVWIHGGMYVIGSNDDWCYDGSRLAARGLVVVVIQYRLNVHGFATFDEQTRNNGVRDQRTALEWVHKNIEAFGGDPESIGIFGESAGATSVTLQALHELNFVPSDKQVIKRAISESNPLGIILENPGHKKAIWTKWETKNGPAQCQNTDHCKDGKCTSADHFQCLKNNDLGFVLQKAGGMMMSQIVPTDYPTMEKVLQNFYGYGPCLDGKFIKHQPAQDVVRLKIPTIQGTNREEGNYFSPMIKLALLAMGYDILDIDKHPQLTSTFITLFFGLNVYKHYLAGGVGFNRLTMPFTDFLFTCPMKKNLGKQAGKVYRYQLHSQDACSAPYKKGGDCDSCNQDCVNISCHANEVPVVFGTWGEEGGCCDHADKYAGYTEEVQRYWYTFLSGGEPWQANGPGDKVKILGMTKSGDICDDYGTYYTHANVPEVKDFYFFKHDICDRFVYADE